MVVRGRHLCRRCFILYPTLVVVAAAAAFLGNPAWWIIWLPPIPATVEFYLEMHSKAEYNRRRATLFNVAMAVGVGSGLSTLGTDAAPLSFWLPVVVFGSVWAAIFISSIRGRRR